ncbi:MAG: FKBP-type peptidyl-prolyl cis-trans isomerase [Myxococcota bacterium]
MKKLILTGMVIFVFAGCKTKCEENSATDEEAKNTQTVADTSAKQVNKEDLKTMDDKASYVIAYNLGQRFKKDNLKINQNIFVEGMKTGIAGKKPLLNKEEMVKVQKDLRQKMMKKMMEERKKTNKITPEKRKEAQENKKKAQEFLSKNKEKEGVKETKSGLQYKVLKAGKGEKPGKTDKVKVHYTGTLLDGTVFDSSKKRGKPAEFPLNRVIPGWTEGIPLMKVGAKYKFWIPGKLAYGMRPRPNGKIGMNEMLVFEVELLDILEKGKKTTPKVKSKVIKKGNMKKAVPKEKVAPKTKKQNN